MTDCDDGTKERDLTPEQQAALDKVDLDDIRATIGGVNFSKVGGGEQVWLMVLLKNRTRYPGKNRPERIIEVSAKDTLNGDGFCPVCGRPDERTLIRLTCSGPGTKEEDGVQ